MMISKSRLFKAAALASVIALQTAVLSASPLDDAKKAYAAGKFGEVDDILGTLLQRRPVPEEVLTLSFNAAIKAGRPYTAERRYGDLSGRGAKLPADILFKAAIVAGEIGKNNLRRDRLDYFLKQDTGWNENVERALIILCRTDPNGAYFTRLFQNEQATDTLFEFGYEVLVNLLDTGRHQEVPAVADALLGKFRDKARASRVLDKIFEKFPQITPQLRSDILSRVVRHPLADVGSFRYIATKAGEFGPIHVIDYAHFNKALPPVDLFARIGNFKDAVPAANREEFARKALAFKGLVLARAQKPAAEATPEAKAAYEPEYLLHYLRMIASCPELFFVDNAPLRISSQDMATMFSTVATAKYNDPNIEPLRKLASDCYYAKAWSPEHAAVIVSTYPRLFDTRALFFDSKIMDQVRQTKSTTKIVEVLNKNADRPELWKECLSIFFDNADGAMLKKTAEMQIMAYPLSFDSDNIARYVLSSPAISVGERVNFFRGLFARTGYSEAWRKLVAFGALPNDLKEDAGFKSFAESVKPGAPAGTDPIAGSLTAIALIPQPAGNQALDPKAFDLAKKALDAFNGQFPDNSKPIGSRQISALWDLMRQRCQTPADKEKASTLFVRSFGRYAPFQQLLTLAGDSRNPTNYLAVVGASLKAGAFKPDYFDGLTYPKNFPAVLLSQYYKSMTPQAVINNVIRNADPQFWNLDERFRQINLMFQAHSPAEYPASQVDAIISRVYDELSATNRCSGKLDLEPLAKTFIDEHKGSSYLRSRVAMLYAIEGRGAEIIPRYFTESAKAEPAIRHSDFLHLTARAYARRYKGENYVPLIPLEREGEAATQYQFGALLRDFALPAVKAVPLRHAGMMQTFIETSYMTDRLRDLDIRAWNNRANCIPNDVLNDYSCAFAIRAQSGMPAPGNDWPRLHWIHRRAFTAFVARGDFESAAAIARLFGRTFFFQWDTTGDGLVNTLQAAMKSEAWEPAHIVASAVNIDNTSIANRLQRIRSDCSTHMPGIYPVDESSPLYPLYVAADELERNNSERSWSLLNNPKNLQTFEREAAKLPAGFVAWGVEQLRRVRGKNDEQLLRARKIASNLLANESAITPELAASLMLTKAECYRDQRNYAAAQLEYQTIRNGAYYKGTKAARKAMFRDVDLLIEMGNASQAEQIVELWVSQPDPEIRAQAHYFMARIAFDSKDYEETRKQLDEVFSLDYTHTDARLLHGQWKLATNSEVDDTNVWVGDLSDRTILRPGQELTVSVQDRNLGIAGGGNSIPVIVTTSEGKDKELLNLYPSVRNPALFNGSMTSMLGAAVPGNHILEICGGDEVSYQIDPEFLSARGLKAGEPKVLKIVDDARLAIGAAAPRSEDGKAEEALEASILSSVGTRSEDISYNLKPGNKVYVVVRDRDRSLTGEADVISVDARTSSGDRLEGIELTETEPFSGIFRGEIPTQLPPPRASASDSAIGVNPGDVINSVRNDPKKNVWKSASDGVQGKWFEVDTMGSHLVSNVFLKTPSAKEITSIRLTGSLAGDRITLGTLPLGDISKRYGIHYQSEAGARKNSASLIRSQFSSIKAPAAQIVKTLAFTPQPNREQQQNAMLSAPFMLPKDEKTIRFHLEATDTKGRTLQGLWMAIAIDGIEVFSGQGNSLHLQTVPVDVAPGPHLLEVFFSGMRGDDAIKVMVEDASGKTSEFPGEWVDPKVNQALADFVKDTAQIHRVEGGFQAVFSQPVRLRSLRWEFLGYNGRDISIEKIAVWNDKGERVIPVESDYSDALRNDVLEVAPGDHIMVTYADERTSSGERRVLERSINSSFHDAALNFMFEEIARTINGDETRYYAAYRFVPGDMLVLSVTDPDGDVSPEADKVTVKIETRSGLSADMSLLERKNPFGGARPADDGIHGGNFIGLLRTCDATSTNVPRGVLPISAGDVITMTYHDRENTKPGVPTERRASVKAAQPSEPQVLLFDTTVRQVEDTSYDAKLRLAQIRRRPGNEGIQALMKDVAMATKIPAERLKEGEDVPANVATAIPLAIIDPSRARHEASTITIDAVAESELKDAEETGRDPDAISYSMKLSSEFKDMKSDLLPVKVPGEIGLFAGVIPLRLGPQDPGEDVSDNAPKQLPVNGNDRVRVRIFAQDGSVQDEYWFQLVSDARIALMDSTYSAERNQAHVGERFYIMVRDADQDTGEDLNTVEVSVSARGSGVKRKAVLRETLPHSGVFSGTIRPVIFAPGEDVPAIATGGVAQAEEEYLDDRIAVRYGDKLEFSYLDKTTIPSKEAGDIKVAGDVFKGSDGSVRLFSKRFRDSDMAVLVQFRLAECLFESAKEFRRLKQPERSAEAIDKGKHILEEALRNYPTTVHLVQGEYLLANLYQELATEEKDAGNKAEADKLFSEALSRFAAILGTWPESEFAPKAQYHKALCLEMLGDYNSASEEYVKMTYLYPESALVGDAAIRLATHYYKLDRFDTAGRIYSNFQKRFPAHEKADRALFMSAQCHMKQAQALSDKAREKGSRDPSLLIKEEYKEAVDALNTLIEQYRETASVALRAQALYWAGDASLRSGDYQNAYLFLKRTTFEYPDTEWARRARGLLLQESKAFKDLD